MLTEVNGQTIYYCEYGKGLPLVILHGLYLDSISMENAIEGTSIQLNGFRRIYVDMPGMGQSPPHHLNNDTDTMLSLLSGFVEQVVGDHPFIVMGFSYGGYLAQGIAKRFMGQLIGECLICPVVIADRTIRRTELVTHREIDEEYFKKLDEQKQVELLERMVVINARTHNRSESDFSRAIALANKPFITELSTHMKSEYIERRDCEHSHRSLIFLGYQDNAVGYLDMLDQLDDYPKATISLLTNASHSFFLEQPVQFEFILNAWLSQYKV